MPNQQRTGLYGFSVLSFIFFFVYLHRVSSASMVPDLVNAFSTTATELGILSSMYFFSYALMQIPSGILIDSIGPRKTATIFTALTALGSFFFGISQTLLQASIARFIVGLGVSVIFVSSVKFIAIWFKPNESSTYFGIYNMVGNLGAIGASPPLAYITLNIGWRITFGFLALIAMAQAVIAWVFIQDNPHVLNTDLNKHNLDNQTDKVNNQLLSRAQFIEQFQKIIHTRIILKLASIVFVTYGTLIAFQGLWGIPFLTQVYQFSNLNASYLIILIAIGFSIGAPLFGFLSDKVIQARRPVYCFGVIFYTLMWIPLALFTGDLSTNVLYSIYFGLGFFHGAIPLGIIMIKESVDKKTIGLTVGFFNIFPILGIAIFQPFIGWILDSMNSGSLANTNSINVLGYSTAFQVCLICLIIMTVISLTLPETYSKSANQDAQ